MKKVSCFSGRFRCGLKKSTKTDTEVRALSRQVIRMDLLAQYLEVHPGLPPYRGEGEYRIWDDFINSDARCISAIACRKSGKTTALMKRAILKKDKDAILIVPSSQLRRHYFDMLCRLILEMDMDAQITRDSNDMMELYVNDHFIHIEHSLEGYVSSYRSNKQLLFDEPEIRRGIGNMNTMIRYLNQLNSDVVMAGSMVRREDTVFKQYHRYAQMMGGYVTTITGNMFPSLYEAMQESRRYMSDQVWRMEYMCDVEASENEPHRNAMVMDW
jgi:hypothetical protein